jgi:hypothetical protein
MEQENIITINGEKDHPITFTIDMDGIDNDNVSVRLSIELSPGVFLLLVSESTNDKFKVVVPAKSVPIGTHDYVLEVIADEHYFVAMNGTAKVTGAPKVKGAVVKDKKEEKSKPSVTSIKVDTAEEEKKDAKKESVEITVSEPVLDAMVEFVEETSSIFLPSDPGAAPLMEEIQPQISVNKDGQVKEILEGLGLKPSKPNSLKRFLKS